MIITIGVNLTIRPGGTAALYNLPETKNNSVVWKSTQKKIYSRAIFCRTVAPMPQLWVPIKETPKVAIIIYLIQHYPQTSINPFFYQQYCQNHQCWLDVLYKAYSIRQK